MPSLFPKDFPMQLSTLLTPTTAIHQALLSAIHMSIGIILLAPTQKPLVY